MTPQQREAVLQALWPEGDKSRLGVWAILDCARDPRIYLALLESRLEFRCLYGGRVPQALEMVAPHLVELFPSHRLTHKLLDEGWGQSWGVFLKIDDPANLRHHLRKFLKVQDEAGRRLLFRYYDPRVLPAFLRSCEPEQLRGFFGGDLQGWATEVDGGTALTEFRLQAGRLREQRLALPA